MEGPDDLNYFLFGTKPAILFVGVGHVKRYFIFLTHSVFDTRGSGDLATFLVT